MADDADWKAYERLIAEQEQRDANGGELPPQQETPEAEIVEHQARMAEAPRAIESLGHDRGVFYYLSHATKQVVALEARQHTKHALMAMASMAHHWQRGNFMSKNGVKWDDAADNLMNDCRLVGIFNSDRLRGRGAWIDQGRGVLHLGSHLLVEGHEHPLRIPNSRFIYEAGQAMNVGLSSYMPSARAAGLLELCRKLNWEHPDWMGRLFAGWLVIASVCGAMPWRPHLWIAAEAGAGKSYIYDNIIRPILGDLALWVQGKTTEAGIRAALLRDARPVIFDEADTQNELDRARMQQVLDLARQASSEGGAEIIKGTQTGGKRVFRIRSCFLFSSINVGLSQAADESRTIVLTLKAAAGDPIDRTWQFEQLKAKLASVITPDFAASLLARTLRLLPVIRLNAEVFAQAITRSGQSRRVGDTFGVVLAGSWSLRSEKMVTADEADDFLRNAPWMAQAMERSNNDAEWKRALVHLAQQHVRIVSGNGRVEPVPVGELAEIIAEPPAGFGEVSQSTITKRDAADALGRFGMRVDCKDGEWRVTLANQSTGIAESFRKTPWASSWRATVERAPGAGRVDNTRFVGFSSRGVTTPLILLVGGNIPDE